ncbi:Solute carrier family 15 member 1 [Orchesella cincta]|uniref:Oligopeptide transporter 1 n=1 Tax=Orchesella cincta TaxID=48709 RepID=A0A1D2MKG1_ORCCI|nr:Solute carrier family 15 member 1 [Orchesella cincta]
MSDDGEMKVVRRNSVISSSEKDGNQKPAPGQTTDFESMMEKIPYPKAVFFIIVCEFCERFCYYGMRAVLTLYFKNALGWNEDFSTVIYHVWVMLCYFTPLLGAMLADSFLGKFRTIFYLSVVYCTGSIVLSVAATPPLHIPTVAFSLIGLALIALGTGGIKPCVAAFGGDQFQIPGQESQLESYFAVFYFSINSGSLLTQIVTPIFREDISCFGDDSCYPLAFSVPAALMIVALIIFLVGRPMYKIVKPQGNIVLKVMSAVKHSFSRRGKEIKAGKRREHWIDYADDKFDQRFLNEAKVVFKVLFLYIPLPIFWTLFDQQGSRWTFQATRMNGHIAGGFGIKPDQMQVANPILVLAFIPLFDRVIYPLLAKVGLLKKPLQRLAVGLFFAGVSFVVSGIIELTLVPTYAVELAEGESNLHFVNALPCQIKIAGTGIGEAQILPNEMFIHEAIGTKNYTVQIDIEGCPLYMDVEDQYEITLKSQNATTYVAYLGKGVNPDDPRSSIVRLEQSDLPDELEKSENGDPIFRVIWFGFDDAGDNIEFKAESEKHVIRFKGEGPQGATESREIEPKMYWLSLVADNIPNGVEFVEGMDLELGGSYLTTVIRNYTVEGDGTDPSHYAVARHEITSPNSVHMLWLLPQFVIMTIGEIMFSITIMDFSYTESPPNMKSVMQSAWLMTVAFGNLIVVIIAEAKIFKEQYKEFFLFAGIMFVDLMIFAYMAYRYVPTEKFWLKDHEKKDEDTKEKSGKDNDGFDRDD